MVHNGDEASTSHNVFNERLEDAYFDASKSFHDSSNVHTYYQPYPHEKKWTKDHPLYKIIGDPKSSVRTRGQLANSCLFSCLLSSIEPVNVAEALRDADWVSSMQEELDQFARLKVWRLIPRPEGKSIIKTKWIFKNKKDESIPTPMVEQAKLKLDLVGKPVDHTDYHNMIESLMYVTSSRPDIMSATCDKLVCWSSKKQNCVSISIEESEYVAVSGCCAQVLWMRTQLTDYGFYYDKVPIYCDSKSAIAILCNLVQHTRTKHIDVRYHFIKDHVEKGTIELYFVGTEYQLADLFTKSLPEARFKFLVEKLGMMSHET
nr:retrovirus-related Pol polyprotein from transposon TNT 1-94 [Tanacetum cinerariifolium]